MQAITKDMTLYETVPAHIDPAAALPRDQWVELPCPPWCTENHTAAGHKDELEYSVQERWHSVCLATGVDVCIELSRIDTPRGQANTPRIHLGADRELLPADALLLARLLPMAVAVLNGQLSVAQFRAASGVSHH